MRTLGPAPEALSKKQVLALHGDALDKLVQAAQDKQYEFERLILINQAKLIWHFVKGHHFQVPGMVDSDIGRIADWIAPGSSNGDDDGADTRFCYPMNLIGGDCYKFVAVMGNSAPRVKAVADDPQDNQNIEDAANADANIRDLWTKWQADRQQRVMAFHQYTTGPTFWRTPWVVDRKKYGQTTEPNVTEQTLPDGSVIPMESGDPMVYPNGDAELQGFTVLEVTVPYMAKTLREAGYLICEVMRPKWELLSAYAGENGEPGPLDQYRTQDMPDDDSTASSNSAAEARESVSTPSGTGTPTHQNQWRHREFWFEPQMYEVIEDAEARELFKRQYPDGLYLAKVGKIKCEIDARDKCEEWSVCKTGRGEKIMEPPIAADAIPYQRALNDLVNLAIETVLRAIAKTIIDSQLVNRESLRENEGTPAEVILTTMPVDGDLNKRLVQIPPARVSDQLVPLVQELRLMWQDNTGIRPELTGGGQVSNTFREAKQRKDQALLQLSPQAQEMQYCWEDIARNGVKKRATFGSGTIKVPRKTSLGTQTDVVDMARLSDGGWHTEADDNFPMTAADRFDKMWGLLKEFPPEVQQALSILDPMNLEQTIELLQIPGFESVMEDQKQKTLADVVILLAGQPIDGQPNPDGSPGPKQPSIPVDQWDDHAFVSTFLPKWMVSKTGRDQKQQNPNGFANIEAFWQAHSQLAQPAVPPPPPPVRAALNVAAKLEDMSPEFANEILQGASLQPMPHPQQQGPSPNMVKEAMAPQPVEQGQPEQSNPDALPPLPQQPGPAPSMLQ